MLDGLFLSANIFIAGCCFIIAFLIFRSLLRGQQHLLSLAHAQMTQLNIKLETLVAERTNELLQMNEKLTVEIAERRFAEEQLQRREQEICQALKMEKELSELKSRFVSMASHEFRTPLATILFSAGLLENYGYKWTEEKKLTHLHRIQISVKQMTQLLDDLLFIGKAEAGKHQFNPGPLELEKFCSDLLEELQMSDAGKHVIKFAGVNVYQTVCMDENLLRPILNNLLSNAMKYSPLGSTIELELSCKDNQAIFQVNDQGIGIPPKDLKRLFEPFYRAGNSGTISGTGLGLTVVKQCVDLHKGQIEVKSEVGVGTTFIVKLPVTCD